MWQKCGKMAEKWKIPSSGPEKRNRWQKEAMMKTGKIRTLFMTAAIAAVSAAMTAGFSFPARAQNQMGAVYSIFQNGTGWSSNSGDNTYCQAPSGSYVTAMKATLSDQPEGMTGTISYQVNLSGSGWLDIKENYNETGTTETAMPLEAIRMQLTGQLAENYDLYYSVLQNGAWTALAMNGETAGTEGQGLRVDGIRVAVRPKGAGAPEEPAPAGRTVDPSRPMVALTFDDGPSKYTDRILNSLEANHGAATFFMVGNRVGSYPATVKRMVDLGCEPASHTWDHTYLTRLSEAGILANLAQADSAVSAAAGVTPRLGRPPGGYINDASRAALAKKGVPAIMWSIDTLDWKTKNSQATVDTVLGNVKDGDIILMHDLYSTSADAAEVLIPELTRRGYQLVTVSEMAACRGGMQPGQVYSRFRP